MSQNIIERTPQPLDAFYGQFLVRSFPMMKFIGHREKYLNDDEKLMKVAYEWATSMLVPRETKDDRVIVGNMTDLDFLINKQLKGKVLNADQKIILRAIVAFVVDEELNDSKVPKIEIRSMMQAARVTSNDALRLALINFLISKFEIA